MLSENQKILFVDDEPETLELTVDIFRSKGYDIKTIDSGDKAIKLLKRDHYNIVITDFIMPGLNGIELLTNIKEISPQTEVIVISGQGTIESAVEAIQNGAYNYITKPINNDYLFVLIDRILKYQKLQFQYRELKNQLEDKFKFDQIIGKSEQMQKIFELIRDISEANANVLIRGETGTGKEVIANAIHYNSLRKDNTIVRVNCGALAGSLLESELFGHVKGAFTGAYNNKIGRFEKANKGTLFLDEIGDISPDLQVKLLRVLQEGEFELVGGTETKKVDVRIIAATHKNLEEAIKKSEFRQDLYYRLNVIPIEIPPLRDRIEDIPLLVNHFMKKICERDNKKIEGVTEEALSLLMSYEWPGNVRELENIIERAVTLTKEPMIGESQFSFLKTKEEKKNPLLMLEHHSFHEVMDDFEKNLIEKVLMQCNGNKSLAAKKLRMHRTTLLSKLTKFGINGYHKTTNISSNSKRYR